MYGGCTLSYSVFLTVQCGKNSRPAGYKLELNKVGYLHKMKQENPNLRLSRGQKALTTEPGDLNLIPRPEWWKEKTDSGKLWSGSHACPHTHAFTNTHV